MEENPSNLTGLNISCVWRDNVSATCSDNDTCDTWSGNISDILCDEDGEGNDYLYKVRKQFRIPSLFKLLF